MEYVTSVPDDSRPLKRCLDNPELTDAISQVGYPAMFFWLEILWLKYSELIPVVRGQLEAGHKGNRSGYEEDGPGHVYVSDGFEVGQR